MIAELRRGDWDHLKAPDEEYLAVAMSHLLPAYFSQAPDDGTQAVLHRLAERFLRRHRDAWLRDVLQAPRTKAAAGVFAALGQARRQERGGDSTGLERLAQTAMDYFSQSGNQAGWLWAGFEHQTAQRMLARYATCATQSQSLVDGARRLQYAWLLAQIELGSSSCWTRAGDFEADEASRRGAYLTAYRAQYPILAERVLGFNAGFARQIGNMRAWWTATKEGLDLYWAGTYPPIRAQQFYSEMTFLMLQERAFDAAAAFARENATTSAMAGYQEFEGYAYRQLAVSEASIGLEGAANEHLARSAKLIAGLLAPEDQQRLQVFAELEVAGLEARLGKLPEARNRLQQIEPRMEGEDTMMRLQYDVALGRLRLLLNDLTTSRAVLENAARIAEHSLRLASVDDREAWLRARGEIYRALVDCQIRSGGDPASSWSMWSRYRRALFDVPYTETRIDPGEAVLSIVELPSGIGVWLGARGRFSFHSIPFTEQLRETCNRLIRNCSTQRASISLLNSDAHQLSNWLMAGWERELDGVHTLFIEGDGPLAGIPWAALLRGNGHYWAQDFAIRIRSGSTASRAPVASSPVQRALVVGAPQFEGREHLPPLPEALEEAKKISGLFHRSTLLTGTAATWASVREGLPDTQLFHFAGHGYGGEGGGLLLRGIHGGAQLLRAADVQGLHLASCRLAVLSGCATGTGETEGQGNPESLVQAFLRAGTLEVVASSWNLNSPGTQLLMQRFYEALIAGRSAAASLQMAQAAVRSEAGYSHPYFWAGLQLYSSE